ncbi:hypothetical protein C8F04DRAFT_1043205 [Mycena alexandri]|uniref:Uncharacterized protein n=2 Tax=Mycena alexandri TaxID=1745969 RepID=A0AAD6SLU1_9AGAR|nr:hypothetical protein C8F04DRAFT_1043205 [Mycena alexandri]
MQNLWQHELDSNEREAESVIGILARFYTRILHSKCKVKCAGVPTLIRLSNPYSGQAYFVGCSNWSRNEKNKHLYWPIPHNVKEADLRFVMEHDGLLPPIRQTPNMNETCTFTTHPRIGLKNCRFSHVVDGKIIPAKMQRRKCPTRMIIFIPVEATPATRHKTILILRNPHNHPMHPKIKPSADDRFKLGAAVQAVGLTGLTARTLLNAPTTSMVYDGNRVAEQSPAFADARKVRDFISVQKKKEHPHGMGWDGVVHRMSTREIDLPKSKQYIHAVVSKNGFKLAVTMHAQLAPYIHRIIHLPIDFTFKRIEGEMDEWEVVGFVDRFHRRLTFASLYCDKKSREAFEQLFIELFATIKRLTGETLKLAPFYPDAKCRIVMLDGEVAQALGFGDFLVNYNNPEISGILSRDPIQLLSFSLKTCTNHFDRHIDELPGDIFKSVIQKLKSIMYLATQEEIDEWHRFCAAQTHPAIQNWYRQKMANPWILPSVNKFLSNISDDNWDITPKQSNLVETAHAGRNAETSIGVGLLTGIMQSEQRDDIIAAELAQFNKDGVARQRFNGAAEREKLSAQRKIWAARKKANRNEQITGYETLKAERDQGNLDNKASLERQKILDAEIKSLQQDLQLDKRRTDLKERINELRRDAGEEQSGRREWAVRRAEIDKELEALRSGTLAGTRINGRRPTERPTGEPEPLVASPAGSAAGQEAYHGSNLIRANEPAELEYMGPPMNNANAGRVEHDFVGVTEPEGLEYMGPPMGNSDAGRVQDESLVSPPDEPIMNDLILQVALDNYSVPYDDLDVPMEYPADLDFAAMFPDGFLANDPFTTTSSPKDDSNVKESLWNVNVQSSNSGSTYDLPALPAPPPLSPPTPVSSTTAAIGAVEVNPTRKRKANRPEVDERDIIPEGRAGRSRTKNRRVRAELY